MAGRKRNGKIELLRFVFSVIIMVFHAGNIAGFENRLFKTGAFAVEFFFIISGYLMMASIERSFTSPQQQSLGKETFLFLKKKVVAIYPEILISWLISIGIYAAAKDMGIRTTLDLMVKSLGDVLLIKSTGLNLGSVNGVVWYISSMLLVMAVLYPLIRKHKDMMLHIVLPVGALLAFGYLCQEAGTMRKPDQWLGWFARGNPRAFAEIAIGAVCYPISQKLGKLPLTKKGKWLCTIAEWGIYLAMLLFMHYGKSSKRDYFYVLILAMAVVITFSGQTVDTNWYNNKFCYWLGKFSLSVYLSHAAWCKLITAFLPAGTSLKKQVAAYLAVSVVTAFVVYFLGVLWRKISPALQKLLRKELIQA